MPKVSFPPRPAAAQAAEQPPPAFLEDGFPNPKAMDFWEYMAQLKAHQWKEHNGYIYRLPEEGSKHGLLLDKFFEPLLPEGLKEKYGGGFYRLHLKRGPSLIYVEPFAIEGPPKTAPAAAASPQLEHQVQLLNSLVSDLIKQRDDAQRDGREFNQAEALKSALEGALDLQKQGFQGALQGLQHQIAPRESSTDKLLLPILELLLRRAIEPQPAPDIGKQLDTFLGVLDKLRPVTAPAESAPDMGTALVQAVGPKLPEMVNGLVRIAEAWRDGQRYRAGAPPAAPAPPGTPGEQFPSWLGNPAARPPVSTVDTPPPEGGLSPPPAMGDTPAPPAAAGAGDPHALAKTTLVGMLYGGRSGDEAAAALDHLDSAFAEQLADVLQTNPAAIATDPILARAAVHPNVATFASEFLEYFTPNDQKKEPQDAG